MDVARPEFLDGRIWLALFVVVAALLCVQQGLAQKRSVSREFSRRFGPAFSMVRGLIKLGLWTAAAWFLLLALATPLGAPVKVESEVNGADIVMAVDVSSSMYAQDVKPNRLTALKQLYSNFISRLDGDRVALVAFAGDAVIACPLTTDYDTAQTFLDKLDTDSVPSDGTGFAPAIKLCLDGFQMDSKRGRMIIFATDGEDTLDTDSTDQAKRAGELGVPIYTISIGTEQGAEIPDRPDIFGRVLPKLYKGQPIIARINPETLKAIASLSGGQYFDGSSPEALSAAYEALSRLKHSNVKSPDHYVRDPLYQKPLFMAIILFLLEMFISNRTGGMLRAMKKFATVTRRLFSRKALPRVAMFLVAILCMAFSLDPGRAENDLGNADYRQNQYDKAAASYEQSIELSPDRFDPHYNLGDAKFMQGDYDGAIQAYEDALKINPNDEDAKFNLDLAKTRKEQQKNNNQKNSKDNKKGNQGQNGQKQNGGQGQNQQQGQGQGQNQQGQGQNQQGQGKGQQGQGQNGQQGQGQQGQNASGQGGQANGSNLSQDQIRAMMNMLKNDEHQYQGAFQPLKRYQQAQNQPQDPMQRMFEEMTGQVQPTPTPGDSNRKDW